MSNRTNEGGYETTLRQTVFSRGSPKFSNLFNLRITTDYLVLYDAFIVGNLLGNAVIYETFNETGTLSPIAIKGSLFGDVKYRHFFH